MVILFLLFGFIVGAASSGVLDSVPSTVVNFVTSPIQKFVANISNGTVEFFKKFTRAEALYEENKLLKEENNELIEQLIDYEITKQENEQYKELLDIKKDDDERSYVPAMIIEMDPENPFMSFTIDKGSIHDISVGDPVINSQSLVGEVISVTSKTATIRTILDGDIALGARAVTTKEDGLISGNLELAIKGFTRMNSVSNNAKMEEGETVLTTGVAGGTYPKGIKIGTVESIHKESFGTSMYAVIKPFVNIGEIRDVFVIIDFKGKGADAQSSQDEEDEITKGSSSQENSEASSANNNSDDNSSQPTESGN